MSLDNLRPEEKESADIDRTLLLLEEISKKLSILIKYESMLHKIDLEEDL